MTASTGARRFARLTPLSLVLLLGAAVASCATVDATSTPYVGAPSFPPTDPASVQILRAEPALPHVRLGEIQVDVSTDPAPPVAEIEEKLRVDGAKMMGANAVVVVLDRLRPVGAYVSGPWEGAWDRADDRRHGRDGRGETIAQGPRPGPPSTPSPGPSPLDRIAAALELTEEQKAAWDAAIKTMRATSAPLYVKTRATQREMDALLKQSPADPTVSGGRPGGLLPAR